MKKSLKPILFSAFISFLSCSEDENNSLNSFNEAAIEKKDTKLSFKSSESLALFLKKSSDDEFKDKIKEFQKKNFKPLLPVFEENDIASKKEYIQKKIERTNRDYKFSGIQKDAKSSNSDNQELEDPLISDNRFAGVLNENRSIYVGEFVYVYTNEGIFKTHQDNEKELFTLLEKYYEHGVIRNYHKNPNKLPVIEDDIPYCDEEKIITSPNSLLLEEPKIITTQLTSTISLTRPECRSRWVESSVNNTGTGETTDSKAYYPYEKKIELGTCIIDDDSVWQQVFGAAETCHDYYDSGRRVKTKFWNQNYLIYSSIGVSVKHQKKNWGIWDASDATDFVELGINNASWTYEYEASHLNEIYNNYATNTLVKYKGKTYKIDGTTLVVSLC